MLARYLTRLILPQTEVPQLTVFARRDRGGKLRTLVKRRERERKDSLLKEDRSKIYRKPQLDTTIRS